MRIPNTPAGVPNPYVSHVAPYPSRFHGSLYTDPQFGMPTAPLNYTVWMPHQLQGLGCGANGPAYRRNPDGTLTRLRGCAGLGQDVTADPLTELEEVLYDAGGGVFRHPRQEGGGVFNSALAGGLSTGAKLGAFFGAAAVVGLGTYLLLKRKRS